MSHVLPNISRGRFFEPIFTSKKFDLYTSIYGTPILDQVLYSIKLVLFQNCKPTCTCMFVSIVNKDFVVIIIIIIIIIITLGK